MSANVETLPSTVKTALVKPFIAAIFSTLIATYIATYYTSF